MLEFDDARPAFYEPVLNAVGYNFLNADVSDAQQSSHTLEHLESILNTPPFLDRAVVFVTADFPRNKLRRQIDKTAASKKAKKEKMERAQNNDVVEEDGTKEGVVLPYDRCDVDDVKEMLRQVAKMATLVEKHNKRVWNRGKGGFLTENPSRAESRYGVEALLKTDMTPGGNKKRSASAGYIPCPVTVLVSLYVIMKLLLRIIF